MYFLSIVHQNSFLDVFIFQKYNYMEVNEHDTFQSNTSKNSRVDPDRTVPYLISVWVARSSADAIGVTRRSMVRKAARLAVYVEIMIRTKNHHTVPITRPDRDLENV